MKNNTVTMETKFTQIKDACLEYNKALADGQVVVASEIKEDLVENVKVYNQALREAEFDKWLGEESPMLAACKQASIEQIRLSVKREENKPEEISVSSKMVAKVFDLDELIEYAKKVEKFDALGFNELYNERIEYAWRILTDRIILDLETGQELSSKEINASAVSNTKLIAQIQRVIDGLLFIPSAKNAEKNSLVATKKADMHFMLNCMSGEGKKVLGVRQVKRVTFLRLIVKVIHRIITEGNYEVEK